MALYNKTGKYNLLNDSLDKIITDDKGNYTERGMKIYINVLDEWIKTLEKYVNNR